MILPGGISGELFAALVTALVAIGALIKHALPIDSRWIPLILLGLGIGLTLLLADTVDGKTVALSVIVVATAIGAHSAFKNTIGKDV